MINTPTNEQGQYPHGAKTNAYDILVNLLGENENKYKPINKPNNIEYNVTMSEKIKEELLQLLDNKVKELNINQQTIEVILEEFTAIIGSTTNLIELQQIFHNYAANYFLGLPLIHAIKNHDVDNNKLMNIVGGIGLELEFQCAEYNNNPGEYGLKFEKISNDDID